MSASRLTRCVRWCENSSAQQLRRRRARVRQRKSRPNRSYLSRAGLDIRVFKAANLVRNVSSLVRQCIHRAKPCDLHFVDVSPCTVPLAVRLTLGIGGKHVPSVNFPSAVAFYNSSEHFRLQVFSRVALHARVPVMLMLCVVLGDASFGQSLPRGCLRLMIMVLKHHCSLIDLCTTSQ